MWRRLRAAAAVGALWAAAALPLIGLWTVLRLLRSPRTDVRWNASDAIFFVCVLVGWTFASGVIFAILVAVAERGRQVTHLRRARLALWGAIGGLLLPIGITLNDWQWLSYEWPDWLIALGIAAAFGIASAIGTIYLSSRARSQL